MCQNNMVVTAVNGFVSKGFMFTAFDVTKFLRAGGSNVRHSDVNTAVKQMFRDGEMANYLRDVKDVGGPVAPFVYYHQNADLDKYNPNWLDNDSNQDDMKNDVNDGSGTVNTVAGVAQPTPSTLGTYVKPHCVTGMTVKPILPILPKGVHSVDKSGRLYIAPVVTQSAGLYPKQIVWVITDHSKIVITPVTNAKGSWPYAVNKDGRIRIGPSVLKSVPSSVGYKVSAATGNIEIVPA